MNERSLKSSIQVSAAVKVGLSGNIKFCFKCREEELCGFDILQSAGSWSGSMLFLSKTFKVFRQKKRDFSSDLYLYLIVRRYSPQRSARPKRCGFSVSSVPLTEVRFKRNCTGLLVDCLLQKGNLL